MIGNNAVGYHLNTEIPQTDAMSKTNYRQLSYDYLIMYIFRFPTTEKQRALDNQPQISQTSNDALADHHPFSDNEWITLEGVGRVHYSVD